MNEAKPTLPSLSVGIAGTGVVVTIVCGDGIACWRGSVAESEAVFQAGMTLCVGLKALKGETREQ